MISFQCPKPDCGGRPQAEDSQAGQQVLCPQCFDLVRVPGAAVAKPAAKSVPKAAPIAARPTQTAAPRSSVPKASPLPAPEQERRWFYELNGAPCGPVTEEDLAALAEDDRLFPYTQVWSEDESRWQPAGRAVRHLFEGLTAADLRPPIGRWQSALGVGLVCVAMAAVTAAGLTYLIVDQGQTTTAVTTKTTRP